MIFYDRETINRALEINDDIQFQVISIGDTRVVKSTEIFKNYGSFLEMYSVFPTFPSSPETNNPFMEQSFCSVVQYAFKNITKKCVEQTLPVLDVLRVTECRGNVGQYSKLKSTISSIFPHFDNENNFQMVCNYWVNVNPGDGTQIWECDKITDYKSLREYRSDHFDEDVNLSWFNIEESDDLKKKYLIEAKNNTCIFYFSNILHSPVINEDDKLRCSIVSWYELGEKNDS